MMFESEESEEGQGLLFECHLQTSNCGPIVSKAASPLDFALQATQMLLICCSPTFVCWSLQLFSNLSASADNVAFRQRPKWSVVRF